MKWKEEKCSKKKEIIKDSKKKKEKEKKGKMNCIREIETKKKRKKESVKERNEAWMQYIEEGLDAQRKK